MPTERTQCKMSLLLFLLLLLLLDVFLSPYHLLFAYLLSFSFFDGVLLQRTKRRAESVSKAPIDIFTELWLCLLWAKVTTGVYYLYLEKY